MNVNKKYNFADYSLTLKDIDKSYFFSYTIFYL